MFVEIISKLNTLSISDLEQLKNEIDEQIKQKKQALTKELAASFIQAAKDSGVDFDKVVQAAKDAQISRPYTARTHYVNPKNPNETWHGKGIKPQWFVDFISTGGDKSSIKKKTNTSE
jgi:DNA-binding protein H-NS